MDSGQKDTICHRAAWGSGAPREAVTARGPESGRPGRRRTRCGGLRTGVGQGDGAASRAAGGATAEKGDDPRPETRRAARRHRARARGRRAWHRRPRGARDRKRKRAMRRRSGRPLGLSGQRGLPRAGPVTPARTAGPPVQRTARRRPRRADLNLTGQSSLTPVRPSRRESPFRVPRN